MSKIPETIWVARNIITQSTMWWEEEVSGGQEYLRADTAAAQVAAAYERAARIADTEARAALKYDEEAVCESYCNDIANEIRAFATDTQTDALEQVRKEAEQAGYERGVREAARHAASATGDVDLMSSILALLDNPTPTPDEQTEAAQELALRKAVSS